MSLSLDEWNVNYRHDAQAPEPWCAQPRIGEHDYTARDAVVEADLFLSILCHADRVRIACQSLLVNVGGPIVAEPGQPARKQTLFEPLAVMFKAARGAVVHPVAVTGPEIASEAYGDSPALGAVALATGTGELMVFAVNRDVAKPIDVEVQAPGPSARGVQVGRGGAAGASPAARGELCQCRDPAGKPVGRLLRDLSGRI